MPVAHLLPKQSSFVKNRELDNASILNITTIDITYCSINRVDYNIDILDF
jgi:hypothetical protein